MTLSAEPPGVTLSRIAISQRLFDDRTFRNPAQLTVPTVSAQSPAALKLHAADRKLSQTMSDDSVLSAWRPTNAAVSLGLSVEYLRKKPAFAKLAFGEWSQVLVGQINRGHFFFVVDRDRRICGFLGWALTTEVLAEAWVAGRSGLTNEQCQEGDCVIFNAWAADNARANRFIVNAGRRLFGSKRTLYFKRHYPDGRVRHMRLATTDFCVSHLARAASSSAPTPADAHPGNEPGANHD